MSADARRVSGASVRKSELEQERTQEAIDAVRRVVAAHDRDNDLSEPLPEGVAARVDQTLAYLARIDDHQPTAPAFEAPDRRRFPWRPALAAAAAVAAVAAATPVVLALGAQDESSSSTTVAAEPTTIDDAADPTLIAHVLGRSTDGTFADSTARERCLAANDVPAGTAILGSQQVTLDGTAGTLFVLPGADTSTMVALVVGDGCGTGNPDLIARSDIG